jgi:predicted RNA binding protein YcfA (HicA-like mRNA interferase family)
MKALSGNEPARLLERNGWRLARVHGSHHVYIKPGGVERLSVPIHGNKPLSAGRQDCLLKTPGR